MTATRDDSARTEELHKLIMGVVNQVTPGAVLVFQLEKGILMSQLVVHGIPTTSVAHLLMESYISGAKAMVEEKLNEQPHEPRQET